MILPPDAKAASYTFCTLFSSRIAWAISASSISAKALFSVVFWSKIRFLSISSTCCVPPSCTCAVVRLLATFEISSRTPFCPEIPMISFCKSRSRRSIIVSNGSVTKIDAQKVSKVVDTTGAGDAFNGAFTVGLANDLKFKDALIFANKVAGISTTKVGAASSMPSLKEVNSY